MAWSDAAREASAEARRKTAEAKKNPTVENHEAASRAHTNAENKNRDAVAKIRGDGAEGDLGLHETAVVHHDKMSAQHQIAAEKLKDNEPDAMDHAKKTRGEPIKSHDDAVAAGRTYGGAKQGSTPTKEPTKSQKFDADHATASARLATQKARANTDTSRAAELHTKAADAHSTAATAQLNAGNKTGAEHHAKMEENHRNAADRAKETSFKTGPGRDKLKHR